MARRISSYSPAQVKIHVPQQRQKKHEKISASVENSKSKPVTFVLNTPNGHKKEMAMLKRLHTRFGYSKSTTASGAH